MPPSPTPLHFWSALAVRHSSQLLVSLCPNLYNGTARQGFHRGELGRGLQRRRLGGVQGARLLLRFEGI